MAELGQSGESGLEGLVNEALTYKERIKKPQSEPLRPHGLLEKIMLSKWTAPVAGAGLATLWYTTAGDYSGDRWAPIVFSLSLGYISASLLRQNRLLGKAEAIRRGIRSWPSKLLNYPQEHPGLIAFGTSATLTAKLLSPIFTSIAPYDILRHFEVVPIAAQFAAFVLPTAFAATYSALSLFGRVFHDETLKAIYGAGAATLNAYRGRYKEAGNNLVQLLQTQRSYGKALALQTLLGDFQLLGQNLECFDTYANVISTEKTEHSGRSDWVITPFISLLKRAPKKAEMPNWAEAEDLSYIIAAAHAFTEGRVKAADTLLASAVKKEKHSLLAHQTRAALMRRTGRHATADLEMRITGGLTMQEKAHGFEEIDGSRNRVLRKGRVVVKLNEEKPSLDGERNAIRAFRGGFGQEVIYPLPIYELGSDYMLLSERDISETLLDHILQRKARLEDFVQAMNLLIRLQKFGYGLYMDGKLPLDESILRIDFSKPETLYFANRRLRAIHQIERFNDIKLPQSYKDAVTNDLLFVDERLASYPHLTMYKDHNPKNVLKRLFGLMQALDFEPQSLRLMPPQLDFVNLLEFAPYLTQEQIRWVLKKGIADFEEINGVKLDTDLFFLTYENTGLQWHYERLIYRPEEAAAAKDEKVREEIKKQQVRHLLASRRHLDVIIEEGYVNGKVRESARRAREQLEHPIFTDQAEYDTLCRIVEKEEGELLLREPLPARNARLAFASAGAFAVLAAAVAGGVVISNNLVPVLNVPVFKQYDKVLLAEFRTDKNGRWPQGVKGAYAYYVVNAENDEIRHLTNADDFTSVVLSAFQDKAVFIRDGRITLYDFVKGEFRTVADGRFENPAFSPDGLWLATNLSTKFLNADPTELWLIRPYDMATRQIFQSGFSPLWSPDGSYLAFMSYNELAGDSRYPDRLKKRINTQHIASGQAYNGPLISERGGGMFAWSPDGLLAYVSERTGQQPSVQLSDVQFKNIRQIYLAGNWDMQGYESESLDSIAFVGSDHLLIQSTRFNQGPGVKFTLSILDTRNLETITLEDGNFSTDVSAKEPKFLYRCNVMTDVCEFDVEKMQSRRLTNTPGFNETVAVYSPNGLKVYVAGLQSGNCNIAGCSPSLFVIDSATGESNHLVSGKTGEQMYLITPQK